MRHKLSPLRRALALATTALAAPILLSAQLDAGILVGVGTYEGELTPTSRTTQIQQLAPSFGVFARYQFATWAAVRGYYQRLSVEGADADREKLSLT